MEAAAKPTPGVHNIDMHPELFARHLQSSFKELFLADLFADVTLKVGQERIPAHKVVLCSWSETFRAMLENTSWKESKQTELTIDVSIYLTVFPITFTYCVRLMRKIMIYLRQCYNTVNLHFIEMLIF